MSTDWPVKKNDAFDLQFPIYDADGDLVSAAAALDTEVSQNGGTFADATNEATEIATASGCYKILLTASEMNTDRVMVITKTSTGGAKTAVNMLYTATRQMIDLAFPATSGRSIQVESDGMVHGDMKEWLGTAPLALASQRVVSSVGAMQSGVLTATAIAANAIGASELATDAIGAAQLAADAVDEIWNESLSGHTTLGTIGQILNAMGARTGAVNDAGATASDFDTDGFTEASADHFNGSVLVFTSGALTGQARIISDYISAGQNMVFDRAWTEAPANSDEFVILGPLAGGLGRLIATESDGDAHADVKEWLGVAPLALVSQRVNTSVGAMAANVLNATAIAADAITAAKIATDAIGTDEVSAAQNNAVADALLKRDIDQVEATAPKHSLGTAVLKSVSRVVDDAGTLKTYRTDGATLHLSQTITVNAAADPIDELAVGV